MKGSICSAIAYALKTIQNVHQITLTALGVSSSSQLPFAHRLLRSLEDSAVNPAKSVARRFSQVVGFLSSASRISSDVPQNLAAAISKSVWAIVEKVQISIQNVTKNIAKFTDKVNTTDSDGPQAVVPTAHEWFTENMKVFDVQQLHHNLLQLYTLLSQSTSSLDAFFRENLLHHIRCVLEEYTFLFISVNSLFVNFHRSVLKFEYVFLQFFLNILQQGFCTEEAQGENQEQDDDKKGELELEDGVGLGDGVGEKDVSDQMDNEEQVMGEKLKGEDEKEKEEQKTEKDRIKDPTKGIEMSNDFDGSMHDVDFEEQDQQEEEEPEDDEERVDFLFFFAVF